MTLSKEAIHLGNGFFVSQEGGIYLENDCGFMLLENINKAIEDIEGRLVVLTNETGYFLEEKVGEPKKRVRKAVFLFDLFSNNIESEKSNLSCKLLKNKDAFYEGIKELERVRRFHLEEKIQKDEETIQQLSFYRKKLVKMFAEARQISEMKQMNKAIYESLRKRVLFCQAELAFFGTNDNKEDASLELVKACLNYCKALIYQAYCVAPYKDFFHKIEKILMYEDLDSFNLKQLTKKVRELDFAIRTSPL